VGDLITFGESVLTITSDAATWLSKDPSVEVGRYDEMDLQLYVLGLKAAGVGSVSLELVVDTTMHPNDEKSWISLGAFTLVASAPSSERVTFPHLLRFARWRVASFSNGALASFFLSGIVRSRL
jgi:hypothetical protein